MTEPDEGAILGPIAVVPPNGHLLRFFFLSTINVSIFSDGSVTRTNHALQNRPDFLSAFWKVTFFIVSWAGSKTLQ